ncbi:unnamed protein product, partial [Dicrocoelium dendriticum]
MPERNIQNMGIKTILLMQHALRNPSFPGSRLTHAKAFAFAACEENVNSKKQSLKKPQ